MTHAFTPDTQQGATVGFSGLSSFLLAAQSIPSTEVPLPTIDATNLGTSGQRVRIAGDLADPKEFTLKFQNDGQSALPVRGTVYTVTITAPVPADGTVGEKWAGSCIVTDIKSPPFEAGANALQMTEIVLQPDGGFSYGGSAWTRTAAS
jgi:hypothetical protein